MDISQAEKLASKLDSLNKYFDIAENTVIEVAEELDDNIDIDVNCDDGVDLLNLNILRQDFDMIRTTLITNISKGREVISALTTSISELEVTSGQVISAYAELVAVVNNSLKLLTSTYKDILSIQTTLNEKTNSKDKGSSINNSNVIIAGNMSDIIKQIQK